MTATQIRGENLAQGQLYIANGPYIPHNFKPCRTLQFAPLLTSNQVIDVQILSAWAIRFSLDYIWRFVLEAPLDPSADNLEHCS